MPIETAYNNPFSSGTSGGAAASYIYDDVTRNKRYDNVSIASSSKPIPPAVEGVPFKTAEDYEAEDQLVVDNYTTVVASFDDAAFELLNILNTKKQQIATIIGSVYNDVGGVDAPSGTFKTKASAQSSPGDAAKVLHVAGITTFNYACETSGSPPVTTCELGAKTSIYPDILAAWRFPKVENLNADVDYYRDGEGYAKITTSNLGLGITAYTFGDQAGVTPDRSGIVTTGTSYGDYYFFTNLSSVNAGAATSIATITNEIEQLRTDITQLYNNTNGTRKVKTENQINLWYEKRGQRSDNLSDYKGVLDTLDLYEDTIKNYNG